MKLLLRLSALSSPPLPSPVPPRQHLVCNVTFSRNPDSAAPPFKYSRYLWMSHSNLKPQTSSTTLNFKILIISLKVSCSLRSSTSSVSRNDGFSTPPSHHKTSLHVISCIFLRRHKLRSTILTILDPSWTHSAPQFQNHHLSLNPPPVPPEWNLVWSLEFRRPPVFFPSSPNPPLPILTLL